MGAAKCLIELGHALRFRHVFQQREDRADVFQMLGVLALKNGGELLADGGQSRYPSVAAPSCVPRSVRMAAAFSVCRVLPAACSLPRLRSFIACITLSKPICCWLVPATIC